MAKKIYFGSVVGLLVALAFSFAHIKPVAAQTTCVAPQEPNVQYTVYSYGIFSTTSHVVTFYEYPASVCDALPETLDPNGEESSDPTNSQAEIDDCKSNAVQYQDALDAYQSCRSMEYPAAQSGCIIPQAIGCTESSTVEQLQGILNQEISTCQNARYGSTQNCSFPTQEQQLQSCESSVQSYQQELQTYQSCTQNFTNEGNDTTDTSTEGTCNAGYYMSGNQCAPLPSNAYATTDGWQCNQGYNDVNDQCIVPPNSTVVNGVDKCDAGYTDNAYNQCVQEQTSTPSVPVTPPVVSNFVSPSIATSPTASNVPVGTFTISQNMNVGASGQNVTDLQNFLIAKGFLTMPAGTNEGYFGGLTKRALISFQSSVGLPDTGYCGPMTREIINAGN